MAVTTLPHAWVSHTTSPEGTTSAKPSWAARADGGMEYVGESPTDIPSIARSITGHGSITTV